MQFRSHQLENGLEIVAECNPQAYSTAISYFVRTGARDECAEIAGVSHFLEHMVFKGTESRSAEDVNRELDELGSQSNAFTSEEQTVYYCTVLPEYQLPALNLLTDVMRPSLRLDDFDMEKQVILEEIAKYADQPPFGAHEMALALHFGDHPLHHSVLGTTESVSALSRDQMLEYFNRQYSPGNLKLVLAGNVDFDAVVDQVERDTEHWIPFEVTREAPRAEGTGDTNFVRKEMAALDYTIQLYDGPSATDLTRHAGRVMSTIFGDDNGSRLFWEFIDTGKAEYAVLESCEYQGTGAFLGYLCCQPSQYDANIQRITKMLADLSENGITNDELELALSKICSHIVLQSERPASRMFTVGANWLQRGTYHTVRESIDQYKAVTREDIQNLLTEFRLDRPTTVSVGPEK